MTFKTLRKAAPLLALIPATAHALPPRIWVAVSGADAVGCGPATNPCRTLQYAHDNIAVGGEIDVQLPGGYGQLTINKSVSIVNDGVGSATIQAATGNGITVNAPGGDVFIRGLTIDGATTGNNGIQFTAGKSLVVRDCTIRHFVVPTTAFAGHGILLMPASGDSSFVISDTLIADNGNNGLTLVNQVGAGNISFVAERVTSVQNDFGFDFETASNATATVKIALIDSLAARSHYVGAHFNNIAGTMNVTIQGSRFVNNGSLANTGFDHGIHVARTVNLSISDSVIAGNGGFGINNATVPASVYSYGNNVIENNGSGAVNAAGLLSRTTM